MESTPVEGTGRKQEQAEGEVELRGRSEPRLGQTRGGIWSQNGSIGLFYTAHGHNQTFLFLTKESVTGGRSP